MGRHGNKATSEVGGGEEYLLFMWDGGPRQPAVERSELYKERRNNTMRAISAILYTTDVWKSAL